MKTLMDDRIEGAFADEYERIAQAGADALLGQRLDALLYAVYRRGYIRGHSARSREVQDAEEQAIREGRLPGGVRMRYEGDRLILDGRDVTPSRTHSPLDSARGGSGQAPTAAREGL